MAEGVALALAHTGLKAQGHTLLCWRQQRPAKGPLSLLWAAKLLEYLPIFILAASADLTPPEIPIFF